jgi:hypothetical protein
VNRLYVAALIGMMSFGAVSAHAGPIVIGRYAGEFLALGAGARALAMGGASVASPTRASAVYYNPAGLAGFVGSEAEFMHASQFENLYTYDYLSYVQKLPNGLAGGITALYTRVGDIPITRLEDPNAPLNDTDNRVVVSKTTSDNELALMAGLGKQAENGWRMGGTAKLLCKTVASESAYGLGFDVGVGRTLGQSFDIGATAHDITTSILAWSTGRTEAIAPSIVVGGAWGASIPSLNARVTVAADLDGHFETRGAAEQVSAGPLSVQPRGGVEYEIARTVALRGGVNGSNWTAGAGLKLAMVRVNAAFQDHPDLGLTNRVSVAVNW